MDELDMKNDKIDCCSLFEDGHCLPKWDWDYLLNNKLDTSKWKTVESNNAMKLRVNKAKNDMFDQLRNETCTMLKIA